MLGLSFGFCDAEQVFHVLRTPRNVQFLRRLPCFKYFRTIIY
jgi:hypothetical protein